MVIGQFEDLVHEEGEEVQEKEVEGKMPYPVAEVVLEVIALVLERIEGLVLDLPSAPAYPHELFHVLLIDRQIGDPRIVVRPLPLVVKLIGEPVDRWGVHRCRLRGTPLTHS